MSAVNVAETLLVFVGAPLAVVVVLALLIFLPGGRKRPRYKSGQPFYSREQNGRKIHSAEPNGPPSRDVTELVSTGSPNHDSTIA